LPGILRSSGSLGGIGLAHGSQKITAGPLTAPAGLGAHPAVLVHLGMELALVAATLAGGRAGLQQRPGDIGVVLGLAAGDPDGSSADVGAVHAQPDALDKLNDVALARSASASAVQACAHSMSASMVVVSIRASRLKSRG